MALRVPIAIAMFVPGAVGYVVLAGDAPLLNHLKGAAFARFSIYDLSVIPLFLLMGTVRHPGRPVARAVRVRQRRSIGHLRGGLAMAAVLACARVRRDLRLVGRDRRDHHRRSRCRRCARHDYSGRLATATLAAGGTLGILIPPSVVLVVYAILTEQNIAKLFAAALIPGIIARSAT